MNTPAQVRIPSRIGAQPPGPSRSVGAARTPGRARILSAAARQLCRSVQGWLALAVLAFPWVAAGAEPTVAWATVAGAASLDYPYDLALAPSGKLYMVGTLDVLNGQGRKALYRFDPDGTWSGSQDSRGEAINGVAVDTNGDYFLTGLIQLPAKLGFGRKNDFYLAKYSAAGALLWERSSTNHTSSTRYPNYGWKIALDAAGDVYVAGTSNGAATFGDVTFPATTGGPLLCKYGRDGALLWAKRVEGRPDLQGLAEGGTINSLALDRDGNIVVTGVMQNGKVDFGGLPVEIKGPYGNYYFIAKYDRKGGVLWAKQSHGGKAVAVDRRGDIYCTGGVVNADPEAPNGMFCGKFSPAGELVWERILRGVSAWSMALDGKDEPVIAAEFRETVELDGLVFQNDSGSGNTLVCKVDAAGKFQWAVPGSGTRLNRATAIVCDRAGNSFVAGIINEDGWLGSYLLTMLFPGPPADAFLARLTDPDAVALELTLRRTASGLALSWPASLTGYVPEMADALSAPAWSAVPGTPAVAGDQNLLTLEPGSSPRFFRLRKP